MADEKSKIVTDATGPDAGPAPVQPEAGGGTPAPKQEQPAPETVSPDKATAPEQATPTQPEKGADAPKEQKAASVSVFNFSEIMAEKKAAEKAAAKQEAKAPDKGTPPTPTKEDGPKKKSPKSRNRHRSAGADRPRPTRPPLPHRRKLPARRIRQYRNPHSREKQKKPLPLVKQRKPPRLPSQPRVRRR